MRVPQTLHVGPMPGSRTRSCRRRAFFLSKRSEGPCRIRCRKSRTLASHLLRSVRAHCAEISAAEAGRAVATDVSDRGCKFSTTTPSFFEPPQALSRGKEQSCTLPVGVSHWLLAHELRRRLRWPNSP